MEIEFRKAAPADAVALAALIYDSGPEALTYVFAAGKKTPADFLVYALQYKGGEFGYGCHTCVWHEGKIIAAGAEFSGEDTLSFLWNNGKRILLFYPFPASLGVIRRGLQVERILVPPRKRVHYIAHLDTDPAYRSKGIGRRLVEFFISNGKKLNRKSVELDVAETNPRAEDLYKKIGFEYQRKKESDLTRNGIRVPGYSLMKLKDDFYPGIPG